jgi:uncharacterized protein (DUF1778 family)
MDLAQYVDSWADQVAAVTALADDRTREVAGALSAASSAAARLVLLEVLSAAAAEITEALLDSPGSPAVSLRLDGSGAHFDVAATAEAPAAVAVDDADVNARVTVRMSERLKTDIDGAAEREGVSLNSWIVRALNAALVRGPSSPRPPKQNPHRITGWING